VNTKSCAIYPMVSFPTTSSNL